MMLEVIDAVEVAMVLRGNGRLAHHHSDADSRRLLACLVHRRVVVVVNQVLLR